jgi:hypothetical protein
MAANINMSNIVNTALWLKEDLRLKCEISKSPQYECFWNQEYPTSANNPITGTNGS